MGVVILIDHMFGFTYPRDCWEQRNLFHFETSKSICLRKIEPMHSYAPRRSRMFSEILVISGLIALVS